MAWEVLCETNNYEDFGACQPSLQTVPAGTKVKLTLQTPIYLPIAPFFDLAGMELLTSYMIPHGVTIIDVEGVGLNTIIVHGEVIGSTGIGLGPVAVALIIAGFVTALAAIGVTVFVFMKLEVLLPMLIDTARWVVYGILAVGAIMITTSLLKRRQLSGG